MMTHMKTTLELDTQLLVAAKATAAQQRITLKALVERALRKELAPSAQLSNPDPQNIEVGPLGLLRLKRKTGEKITMSQIRTVEEELDDADRKRMLGEKNS
jgi:hypothetical protein